MVRSLVLLLLVLFAAPAPAQPTAPTLATMLRAVPPPIDADHFVTATPFLAFIRLDLLAGAPGPAPEPGAARLRRWGPVPLQALGVAGMIGPLPLADLWPTVAGFDLDAVDAVLVAPAASPESPLAGPPLRVLAGAARLHNAARIGNALRRRGFVQDDMDGMPVFSHGEERQISFKDRSRGDPFDAGLGQAQRIAPTPAGLLVTSETAAMRRALATLSGRSPSIADLTPVRAILAGLDGVDLVQAIVLAPSAGLGIAVRPPPAPLGPIDLPPGTGGPMLPGWSLAALADLAAPPDQTVQRIVLALPDPEAARPALLARIEAARIGPRSLAISSVALRVLPQRFGGLGVLLADIRMAPGTVPFATPLARWWIDVKLGVSTPITFGTASPSPPGRSRLP